MISSVDPCAALNCYVQLGIKIGSCTRQQKPTSLNAFFPSSIDILRYSYYTGLYIVYSAQHIRNKSSKLYVMFVIVECRRVACCCCCCCSAIGWAFFFLPSVPFFFLMAQTMYSSLSPFFILFYSFFFFSCCATRSSGSLFPLSPATYTCTLYYYFDYTHQICAVCTYRIYKHKSSLSLSLMLHLFLIVSLVGGRTGTLWPLIYSVVCVECRGSTSLKAY